MSQEPVAADAPSIVTQIEKWHSAVNAESKWHCVWLAMHSRFPEPPTVTFMVHRLDQEMEPKHMTISLNQDDLVDWDDLANEYVPASLERIVNLAAGRAVADLRSREDADVPAK